MTRKQLRRIVTSIIIFYGCALIASIWVYHNDPAKGEGFYSKILKDGMPLIITIPAAYLGFCFQRRSSFLQELRTVWSNLIIAVNSAIQYTHQIETTDTQFGSTLLTISKSIDEIRGVYKNLNETEDYKGLYPFESLIEIHRLVSSLGYGILDLTVKTAVRNHINHNWKNLRKSFLAEFDRSEPTVFDSPYIER